MIQLHNADCIDILRSLPDGSPSPTDRRAGCVNATHRVSHSAAPAAVANRHRVATGIVWSVASRGSRLTQRRRKPSR